MLSPSLNEVFTYLLLYSTSTLPKFPDWFILIVDKSGICGSVLPHQTFQTSSNTLTIRLTTSCAQIPPRFGTFDIIVGVTKKGRHIPGHITELPNMFDLFHILNRSTFFAFC